MPGDGGARPWRTGTVAVAGGHLAYHRTGGDGPALVLSHGLTDNGLCWLRLARALAGDFDVIMLDARGHGESARIAADRPHDPGTDIAEAIDGLGLTSPMVMGHSVGARATADHAGAHPGQVAKVVLEDPPFLPLLDAAATQRRREKFRQQVESFHALSEAEIIATGKAASPLWHGDDFGAWATAKRQTDPLAFPSYDRPWQAAVSRIAAPTLLVHGDAAHGSLVTLELAREVRALNPHVTTIQIAGAGHNTRRENFADYLVAVRAFLLAP